MHINNIIVIIIIFNLSIVQYIIDIHKTFNCLDKRHQNIWQRGCMNTNLDLPTLFLSSIILILPECKHFVFFAWSNLMGEHFEFGDEGLQNKCTLDLVCRSWPLGANHLPGEMA